MECNPDCLASVNVEFDERQLLVMLEWTASRVLSSVFNLPSPKLEMECVNGTREYSWDKVAMGGEGTSDLASSGRNEC